jgi:3-oxoacyl-[acyl-carrier protein] reductase
LRDCFGSSSFVVAFTYVSNQGAAEAVVNDVKQLGGEAAAFLCDAGDASQASGLVDSVVERFGRLDALINNAGITRDTLLIRMSDEQWDSVIKTNLSGVFYTTRAAGKVMMKQRSGAIVNISSVVGVYGGCYWLDQNGC